MTDIAKIVAGLTKAQREAIIKGVRRVEADIPTLLNLSLYGLVDANRDGAVFLTPLGLAVRDALMEEK